MRLFNLGLAGLLIRFYVMMAVILIAGFTGLWWLAALALPIFLSAMMGAKFTEGAKVKNVEGKIVRMENRQEDLKKAM